MATTTISDSTVVFSNSSAAANLTQTGSEDGSLLFTFDVLAASGGGTKTTVYSVDDGTKNDDGGTGIVVTNKAFADYNKDLLIKDAVGVAETSAKGALFWIDAMGMIHYDASSIASTIQALAAGQTFTDTIQYTIKMSNGTLSVGTLTVVINGVNDAPELTGTAATLASGTEDISYVIYAAHLLQGFTDAEGDALSVANLTASNGTLEDNGDGTWTFTPNANYNGTVDLSYSVIDGNGGVTAANQSFSLAAVNDAPVSANGSASTDEDVAIVGGALPGATDVEGDTVTYAQGATVAAHGSVTVYANGTFDYTPTADYNGSDSFSFVVDDGNGGTNEYTFDITIDPVNDAPVNTVPGAQSTNEDTSKAIIGLSIADVDAGSGSMTVTLSVLRGTLTVSGGTAGIAGSGTASVTLTGTVTAINSTLGGTVTYNPTANYNGNDTLTMVTNDYGNTGGGALSDTDTVAITVIAINDPPVATNDTIIVSNSTLVTIPISVLLANDTDIDGVALTITAVGSASGITGLTLMGLV